MKTKLIIFFAVATILLPTFTSLMNVEARSRNNGRAAFVILLGGFNSFPQTTISPN